MAYKLRFYHFFVIQIVTCTFIVLLLCFVLVYNIVYFQFSSRIDNAKGLLYFSSNTARLSLRQWSNISSSGQKGWFFGQILINYGLGRDLILLCRRHRRLRTRGRIKNNTTVLVCSTFFKVLHQFIIFAADNFPQLERASTGA